MIYTKEQQRVADYLDEITKHTIGGGDDPVGFLIASHRMSQALIDDLQRDRKMLLKSVEYTLQQERERCLQAVRDEPELPGVMPRLMFEGLCKLIEYDRALGTTENVTGALRMLVKETKKGIEERIANATAKNEAQTGDTKDAEAQTPGS